MRLPILGALLFVLPTVSVASTKTDHDAVVARASAQFCDKRVVILAELPSHGEAQAFGLKADIVKRLVQHCGFRTLLFEAPIYDFIGLEPRWKAESAGPRQLDRAIGRFWLTRELKDWRAWLFQRANSGALMLGGLDDQVSDTSEYARATLPSLTAGLVSPETAQVCQAAVERNLGWTYDSDHPFDLAEKNLLRRCTHDAALGAQSSAANETSDGPALMAMNLAAYVSRQVEAEDAADRDAVMYRNLQWHLRRLPSSAKLIVWTATVHGSRQQGERKYPPLGVLLQPQLGDALGVIGFTALAGQSSMAGRPAKALARAAPESLEARALGSGADLAFLDKPALAALGAVESRLFGPFSRADWSTRFDAVVVVANEAPASAEAQP